MSALTHERRPPFSPPTAGAAEAEAGAAEDGGDAAHSPTSPYSLSKEDLDQLTEEFDDSESLTTVGRSYEELVLASQSQSQSRACSPAQPRESARSDDTEAPLRATKGHRQSVGFRLGRNSLSNWTTIGEGGGEDDDHGNGNGNDNDNDNDDIPGSVRLEPATGRKSNVSRLSPAADTPAVASHVSHRRSRHVNGSRGTLRSDGTARFSRPPRRRAESLNLSHVSSSSSSGMDVDGESQLGESWSPIRTSLENSFAKSVADRLSIGGQRGGGSLSPIRGRGSDSLSPEQLPSSKKPPPEKTSPQKLSPGKGGGRSPSVRRSSSPKRSPARPKSPQRSPAGAGRSPRRSPKPARGRSSSPVRSPLGDISPNRAVTRARSPARGRKAASPKRATRTARATEPENKRLSPDGTYSLKEVEGARLSSPKATTANARDDSSSNMSVCCDGNSGTSQSASKENGVENAESTSNTSVRISPNAKTLNDVSPNRAVRGRSLAREGAAAPRATGGTATTMTPNKKGLSPNGTYSLKEAKGARLSSGGNTAMSQSASSKNGVENVEARSNTSTSIPPKEKEGLLNLSLRSEGLENTHVEKNASGACQQNDVAMRSPPRHSTTGLPRSPAPTPNSRRRVIKRFRASVPSAKYLTPEDLMVDSMEKNVNRKVDLLLTSLEKYPCKKKNGMVIATKEATEAVVDRTNEGADETTKEPMDTDKPTEPVTAPQATYENAFVFPHDSIPAPSIKTMLMFHDRAVAEGTLSHQYQLNRAGANRLSLQEVILPSIAYETNAVLKAMQSKAQRNAKDGMPDSQGKEVVEAIKTCRRVVIKCADRAAEVVGKSCRAREKERERVRVENFEAEKERQKLAKRQAKKERKEARARSRQQRYERQRREKQRNHPRNKELWQEVTKLMMDIQKLEKEERLWKEASAEVTRLEKHHQPPKKVAMGAIVEEDVHQLVDSVENADLESTGTTLVQDVTMATERINWMLKSLSLAMDESENLRKQVYEKYQFDGHKFYGYPKVDDPKGLFMALSAESPLRE